MNRRMVDQCLLCGSCEHICTKGVEFTTMMVDYRNRVSGGRRIALWKKLILFFYQRVVFKRLTWVVDILSWLPLRRLLSIPRRRRGNLGSVYTSPGDGRTYDVLLFPGCVLGHFYPGIILKLHRYLEEKGFSVAVPRGWECCGAPYKTQGWGRRFEVFRERNKELFGRYKFKTLLVPCGTGVKTFRGDYGLGAGVRVMELTEFFHEFLKDAREDVDPGALAAAGWGSRVTWHDPCHHLKALKISRGPRYFMEGLGEGFVDDDSGLCCGFGGIFSVGFPSTSRRILERKKEKWKEKGVGTVVTSCPGCYLHLSVNVPELDVRFFIDLFR